MTDRPGTTDRITGAALELFVTHGLSGASMEQIRRLAGVSNGSLYHHFPSRAALAARMLVTGMELSQQTVLQALSSAPDARAGVRRVVAAQLGWVEDNADWARLLLGDLPDDVLIAAEPRFSSQNRDYVTAVGTWLGEQAERGALVERPFEIAHALWLGPGQEFARHWLSGRTRRRPSQVAGDLAEGAWRALAPDERGRSQATGRARTTGS